MNPVLRALSIYVMLWLLLRIGGRRTLGDLTNFDFVILLVIGDAAQQALVGDDYSVSNATIVIGSLVLIDVLLSLVKRTSARAEVFLDGRPLIVVDDGEPLRDVLRKARIGEEDILAAARERQGLERMDQIKWAILECTGAITIIPRART